MKCKTSTATLWYTKNNDHEVNRVNKDYLYVTVHSVLLAFASGIIKNFSTKSRLRLLLPLYANIQS